MQTIADGEHVSRGRDVVVTTPPFDAGLPPPAYAGPGFVAINVLASVAAVWFAWGQVPNHLLVPWLFFAVASAAVHLGLLQHRGRLAADDARQPAWRQFHTLMLGVLGLAWGAAGITALAWLTPTPAGTFIAAVLLLALLAQGSLAQDFGAYLAYLAAMVLPPLVWILTQPLHSHTPTALLLAGFGAGLALVANRGTARGRRALDGLARLARQQALLSAQAQELHAATQRLRQENRRRETAASAGRMERLRTDTILRAIRDAVIATDASGTIRYMNPIAEVLTGWSAAEVRGRPLSSVYRVFDPATRRRLSAADGVAATAVTTPWNEDGVLLRRDGLEYTIGHCAAAIRDDAGRVNGRVVLFHDLTAKRSLTSTLAWHCTHDALTGVLNRCEFEARLGQALAADARVPVHTLCYVDLDRFAAINDAYGVKAGSELLRRIAAVLRKHVRDADAIGRTGADEFAVLLHGCAADKSQLIAQALRAAISACELRWKGAIITADASVAVVALHPGRDDVDRAFNAAGAAIESARARGAGRVQVYRDDDETVTRRAGALRRLATLREALAADRFTLFHRPVLDLQSGDSIGYHTIETRLDDDGAERARFAETAQRYRLERDIDRWTVKAVLDALRLGHPVLRRLRHIGIPVCTDTLADDLRVREIIRALDEPGVPAERLCFEITEPADTRSLRNVRRFIALVHDRGCRVTLADFGAGAGGLVRIGQLRADYVKLAGHCVNRMTRDSTNYEVVVALNRIARTLGMRTIACGVSDQATWASLRGAGVDFADGRLAGAARPLELAR
ncbi:MAG: EAL domain-containing protein [Gammaproteobacteria bacterium]|nr:EAL domain-containing protein [Gammaproteobacteria bacterium]